MDFFPLTHPANSRRAPGACQAVLRPGVQPRDSRTLRVAGVVNKVWPPPSEIKAPGGKVHDVPCTFRSTAGSARQPHGELCRGRSPCCWDNAQAFLFLGTCPTFLSKSQTQLLGVGRHDFLICSK